MFVNTQFLDYSEVVGSGQKGGRDMAAIPLRLRPQALPRPRILGDFGDFSGYVAAEYWEREDAYLIHPPLQNAVCAVCRRIPLSSVVHVAAAVHVARADGPGIGFSIGVAPADAATPANWGDFVGPVVNIAPGGWGVVEAEVESPTPDDFCDLLLVTRVLGRATNDNAWALFRRFVFSTAASSAPAVTSAYRQMAI